MKIHVRQVKSAISKPEDQKRTIKALGLGKLNRTVELEDSQSVLGMIRKVQHLVEVTPA